jgi:hypothetical protein
MVSIAFCFSYFCGASPNVLFCYRREPMALKQIQPPDFEKTASEFARRRK